MAAKKYTLEIIEPQGDGWWLGTVPEVPGVCSQGRCLSTVIRNTAEALVMVLKVKEELELENRSKDVRKD